MSNAAKVVFVALVGLIAYGGLKPMKTTIVADMHWSALLGHGWTSADPGTSSIPVYSTTATASVAAGGYTIPVAGNLGFNAGILATYLAADGEWYPFRVVASTASLITADRPLNAINSGATVSNVYRDDAHPNVNGGAMIVDDMLRQIAANRLQEVEKKLREAWASFGGATVAYTASPSYLYPGSDVVGERAAQVSGSAAGGVVTGSQTVFGGDYIANIAINTGLIGGAAQTLTVSIEEQTSGVWAVVASVQYAGTSATHFAALPFSASGEKPIRFRIASAGGAAWNFMAGQIDILRVLGTAPNLNSGKIVVLADSWGTPGSPILTRLAARLPNATIVAKGVGGNRSDQLIARFAADVTAESPDIVLVIVGTNDYYQNVTPSNFDANIATLKSLILGIGARPVFLTASVGSAIYSPSQLYPSRRYMTFTRYHDLAAAAPTLSAPWRVFSGFQKLTVPASSSAVVFTLPGVSAANAFLNYLSTDNPAVSVEIDNRRFEGDKVARKWWTRRAARGPVSLLLTNQAATDQDVTVSAEIHWTGDLS